MSNKYTSSIESTDSANSFEYEAVDILIYPKNTNEAISIGKAIYTQGFFYFGISQIDMNEFRVREDINEYGKNSKYYYGSYSNKTLIPIEELFTKEFQYKYMAKKLNDCSKIMNTFDGVLYCYSQRDIKDHAWENASNYFAKKALEETGNESNIRDYYENIPTQIQVEQKKLIEEYKSKEANGAYKGKFNNFQTTYKKLFGSEYIK